MGTPRSFGLRILSSSAGQGLILDNGDPNGAISADITGAVSRHSGSRAGAHLGSALPRRDGAHLRGQKPHF